MIKVPRPSIISSFLIQLSGPKPKANAEPTLTKEQLEEIKKKTLAELCKPLKTEGVDLAVKNNFY